MVANLLAKRIIRTTVQMICGCPWAARIFVVKQLFCEVVNVATDILSSVESLLTKSGLTPSDNSEHRL